MIFNDRSFEQKLGMTFREKIQMLADSQIITAKRIARDLGMSEGGARNLLAQWNEEGIIRRTGRGCYVSTQAIDTAKPIDKNIVLNTLLAKLGKDIILIGGSSWEEYGWAKSDLVHVATPRPPSDPVPTIYGASILNIGVKNFHTMLRSSAATARGRPQALDPVMQMLWWMSHDCPIPLLPPHNLHWDVIDQQKDLPEAVLKFDPDIKEMNAEYFRIFYTILEEVRSEFSTPKHKEPEDDHGPGPGRPQD